MIPEDALMTGQEGRYVYVVGAENKISKRTVTVGSAGKTFSVTGWKIGWACAPARLVTAVRTVKQFLTYVNGAPFQVAGAHVLGYAAPSRQPVRSGSPIFAS